jgi:hypothetical protein
VKYELGFYIPEGDILHSHRREYLKSNDCSLVRVLLCDVLTLGSPMTAAGAV